MNVSFLNLKRMLHFIYFSFQIFEHIHIQSDMNYIFIVMNLVYKCYRQKKKRNVYICTIMAI